MSPALLLGITLGVLAVAITIWTLVDLSQHEVAYLPKWAWAAIIVVLSVVGSGIYLVAGRVPAGGDRPLVARLGSDEEQEGPVHYMMWGMVIGMIIGTALGQIALGLAVGLAVGALVDAYRARQGHG